jgi:hypothetical protein
VWLVSCVVWCGVCGVWWVGECELVVVGCVCGGCDGGVWVWRCGVVFVGVCVWVGFVCGVCDGCFDDTIVCVLWGVLGV